MITVQDQATTPTLSQTRADSSRLDYLDATRAFALLLGIVFHASLSFVPVFMGWAVQDISTSALVTMFMTVSHSFRMETFFLLAGFFSHLLHHRKGTAEFIRSRALRIGVPFVLGWFILHPLLVSGWIMGAASLRGHIDIWAGLVGGFQTLSALPSGLFTGSHLWFLYYLALVTTLTLAGHGILRTSGRHGMVLVRNADALVEWLAHSSISLPLLAIPTAAALWFMRFWSIDTPDQSLTPNLPVLFIYGGFFLLGWLLSRQPALLSPFARLSIHRWILAALGIAAILLVGQIERDPGHPNYLAAHIAYALTYALTMWSLVVLTIGLFQKLCPRPNSLIRYIADSSYWMYLIHLPLVLWLQIAVAEWPLHWSIKLAFISLATIALSLLTYDLFVRSTFIGRLLNGRSRSRLIVPWLLRTVGQTPIQRPQSITS